MKKCFDNNEEYTDKRKSYFIAKPPVKFLMEITGGLALYNRCM